MPMTTMTTKGQVTLPKAIRDKLHLKPHDKIVVTAEGARAILRPIHGDIRDLKGIFKHAVKGPIDFKKLRRDFERAAAGRVMKVLEKSRSR